MDVLGIYERLLTYFGRQGWWPAKDKFEIIVGAILTQQTTWRAAEKGIEGLREAGLLSPERLAEAKLEDVERLIRGTGFYRQKARNLIGVAKYLVDNYHGSLDLFFNRPLEEVRRELLSLKGIGYETADSLLLYIGGKPILPIDAYTQRIFDRLGLKIRGYEELQTYLSKVLPKDLEIYKEFHALLVELGKNFCRKNPICPPCPLREICEYGKEREG